MLLCENKGRRIGEKDEKEDEKIGGWGWNGSWSSGPLGNPEGLERNERESSLYLKKCHRWWIVGMSKKNDNHPLFTLTHPLILCYSILLQYQRSFRFFFSNDRPSPRHQSVSFTSIYTFEGAQPPVVPRGRSSLGGKTSSLDRVGSSIHLKHHEDENDTILIKSCQFISLDSPFPLRESSVPSLASLP